MAWLVSHGNVIASAEVAGSRRERGKGLLGKDSFEGAFVIPQCNWVHTVRMRFPIDVAYVDEQNVVVKTERLNRHRVGAPVRHATWVVEAEAGAFARWGLRVGDPIELRL